MSIAIVSVTIMLALYGVLIPRSGGLYGTLLGFSLNDGLTREIAQRVYRIRYEWVRLAMLDHDRSRDQAVEFKPRSWQCMGGCESRTLVGMAGFIVDAGFDSR